MGEYLKDIQDDTGDIRDPFTQKHMKNKLAEYYGDRIMIANKEGLSDVVTFTSRATDLLHDYFQRETNRTDDEEEKRAIIIRC
jgi:hypothetical protein